MTAAAPPDSVDDLSLATIDDPIKFFRVEKMSFGTGKDRSVIHYNTNITITDVPLAAYDYIVNGKPAIDWVMERQAVKVDKDSGIVNDANDYATETVARSSLNPAGVKVSVDRPGVDVVLLLMSGQPQRWLISLTPGTKLDHVILGGDGQGQAVVTLGKARYLAIDHAPVTNIYSTEGVTFRRFLATLPQVIGTAPLTSFQSRREAPPEGFFITQTQEPQPELCSGVQNWL